MYVFLVFYVVMQWREWIVVQGAFDVVEREAGSWMGGRTKSAGRWK